jgi:DNA-binding GntR family transcriptional regulator
MTPSLHEGDERLPKRDRDAFSSALSAIRGQLRAGGYVLGEALIIKDLSDRLRLSPTPVREALARLSGEGLVEERRGSGYFAPALGVTELTELYEAHQALVLAAVREPWPTPPPLTPEPAAGVTGQPSSGGPSDYVLRTERVFDAIVRAGGNRPLFDCYRRLADRLAPARFAEMQVLGDIDEEFGLLRLASERDHQSIPARVRAFHRRRLRHAQDIVRIARRNAAAQPQQI